MYFLILFLFGPCLTNLEAQSTQYKQWQVEDGLPQNSVNKIFQTRDGYIWLATHGGLARFDGVKFSVFNIENTPAFKTNRIVLIMETNPGELVIATSHSHLVKYKDGVFSVLYFPNQHTQLLPALLGSDDDLWILEQYTGTLVVIDNNTGKPKREGFELLDNIINVRAVHTIGQDKMMIMCQDTIYFWTKANGINPSKLTPLRFPDMNQTVFSSSDSSVWILASETLYQYKGDRILQTMTIPSSFIKEKPVQGMYMMDGDRIFFRCVKAKESYTYFIPTRQFQLTPFDLGCGGTNLESPLKDREGNRWYATSTCGIFKQNRFSFSYVDVDPAHTDRNSYSLMEDGRGRILIGTKAGMVVFENGKRIVPRGFEQLPKDFVTSFVEAGQNEYYVTYNGQETIHHVKDGRHTRVVLPIRGTAHTLYRLRSGQILVSIGNGMFILKGETVTPHPHITFPVPGVFDYFEDSKNNVWLFSPNDITQYIPDEKRAIRFDSSSGLKAKFFRGAYEDKEGRMYFGSYGLGLTVYEHGKFHNLTTKNGLIENVVSTITEDSKGNLWITGNSGLWKFKKSQLLICIEDPSQKLTPVLFDKSDGIRNPEFNGGLPWCKWPMQDGSFLFAMLDGVVKIDLNAIPENTIPPPVIVESIITEDSVYIPKGHISIDYSKGRIEFNYTALSFVSPKNVRFRYKLEGYDPDWIEAGTERKTSYTQLSPGLYQFKVLASNNYGLWNETGATVDIEILPPFYMTWWFWAVVILLLITTLSAVTITIYKNVKKREHAKAVLMDVLPDLILKVNQQGKLLDIYGNPASLILQFSDIKGKTIWDVLPEENAHQVVEKIKTTLHNRQMQLIEYQMQRQDGQTRDYEGRFIFIDKSEVLYIIRDITESKKTENTIRESEQRLRVVLNEEKRLKIILEQQRKQELKSIVNAEERERRRISKDLHDGVGQLLSSIRFNLGMLDSNTNSFSDKEKTLIENSKKYLQEITGEIRNISYNLVPSSLQQFGLISAIQEEIKNQKVNEGLDIQFIKSVQQERFELEIELVIYRVFQEILNNTLKHAHATELVIQLIQHDNIIQLVTEDDGKGFEVEDGVQKKSSSGLKNLKSRVTLLNGTISIDSTPGKGTTIIIEITIHV